MSKRNQYKRKQALRAASYKLLGTHGKDHTHAVGLMHCEMCLLDIPNIASAATRANHDGTRRHSGIVDATGVTNLTSATKPIKSARSNSHSEAKFTDWRWNMTIQESVDFGIGGRYTVKPIE